VTSLDQAIDAGIQRVGEDDLLPSGPALSGHPGEGSFDSEEGADTLSAGDDPTKTITPDQTVTPPASGEGEPPAGGAPGNDKDKDQPAPGPTPPAPRFKDHLAAEEGYRNLQAKATRTEQELARLRSERLAREQASRQAETLAGFHGELSSYSKTAHLKALKEIDTLDPEDPGYQEKVADIWAKKDVDVASWVDEHRPGPPAPEAVPAIPEAVDGGQPPSTAGSDPATDPMDYANAQAVAAGIDPGDLFFVNACKSVPRRAADGRLRTLQEMVSQVITDTQSYHRSQRERFARETETAAAGLARQHQEVNQPMGASPARVPAPAQPAPARRIAISDALDAIEAERRL
jgi:hypothetical protein